MPDPRRLPSAEITGDLPVRHSTRTTLPSSTAHTPGNCTATLACPQLRRGAGTSSAKLELVNSERVGAVVAVAQPARSHAHVLEVRAGRALAAVRLLLEVGGCAADQILAQRQVGQTLVLR